MLGLDISHLWTKFDDCCLSRSRDMIGVHQNLNGSRNLTTPHSWMVSHLWASTCYDQPIYQRWSLYLHPPHRYGMRYKMSKMWFSHFGTIPACDRWTDVHRHTTTGTL